MSSLRLALKQSLAETGHLAIQDKPKRKHNNARKGSKQKMPSSNKIASRRKKHFSSENAESINEFSTEIGRSMSSVSGSSSLANSTDGDGDAKMRASACAGPAASDDANSLSSHEPSSFSDSDTVTNESLGSSHHRHHHRMHSSDDEDSSSNSQDGREGMQEDMEGVFDMEGTSADESRDQNPRVNPLTTTPLFLPQQQQGLQPGGAQVVHQHQQPLRKKKKKKKKDKGKRKKGRQKLNLASSSGSIQDEENKLLEDKNADDCKEGHAHDEADSLLKKHKVVSQDSIPLHAMGNEPHSLSLRRPTLKKEASSKKFTVKTPTTDVLNWVAAMSPATQRRKIKIGMRVKVCFEFKSNKRGQDGKNIRYYRWCGGGVTRVELEGKQIRILYDDGTEEDTVFPDNEIVVDDNENGKHQVVVDAFLPYTLLAKQPAILMAMNEANQGIDFNDKKVKEEQQQDIASANFGNNDSDKPITQETLPPNTNDLKSVKAECLEETNVVRLHVDPPNEVVNCAPKTSHEPLNSCTSKNNINPPSSTVDESAFDTEIVAETNNRPSSPSWGSNNPDRSLLQSVSSPGQITMGVGAGVRDVSSVRVSNKIKLKRRKSPTPLNHSISRAKYNGIDNISEDAGAISAPSNVTRPEHSTPSLKIRLKTKCVKHKKRMENASNVQSEVVDSDISRIKIKSDQEESNVGELWTSTIPATTNSDAKKVHKPGKAFDYAQGESAWLGDDEGQGLKRSKSELEEASESEKDGIAVPLKVSDQALTAGEINLEHYTNAPKQLASCNNADSSHTATPGVDGCGTPVINFLFKGRKHLAEESSNQRVVSVKSEPVLDSSPVSVPQATVPSLGGMAKKKKTRSYNPVPSSHRSSGVRSPKQSKVGRVERQTGNNPSVSLQENHVSSGKKSKKDRRLSPEQIATFNNNIVKSNQNSKESSMSMREQPLLCHDPESDLVDKLPILPLRSGTIGKDENPKNITFTGRKIAQITKQKRPPIQDGAPKAKRKNKSKNGGHHRSTKEDDREDNSEGDNWVQCENCNKWRSLPNSVDVDTLPHLWYCKDNPDKGRNTCAATEQTQEEVSKVKKLRNAAANISDPNKSQLSNPLTMQNKKPLTYHRPADQLATDSTSKKSFLDNNSVMTNESKLDMMRSINDSPQYDSAVTNKSASSDLLDEQIDDTQMTSDLPLEEGLSAGEIDGAGSDGTSVSNLPSTKNMKGSKKNRKGKGDEKEKKGSKGKKQKEADNQEWVQCEKCEKWRRLPPRIKAKELPDVWTCDMNDWDPRSASCAVQEDYKVEKPINLDKDIIGKDGIGSGAHTNKLSYRNLIRIPNRTISERTRAVDSLFSSCATGLPTVMYANSSVFQPKGGIHKSVDDDSSTISLFDYMNKSALWKDLYQYTIQPTWSSSNANDETISNNTQMQSNDENLQSMKAMVFYALGVRKLAATDVLLECQCREWDDLQWIELRARCTIKSVQLALNALVKDGLIEALPNHSSTEEGWCGTITYCKIQIGINSTSNKDMNAETRKAGSSCMKISKPWKKSRMGTGF